MKAQKTCPKCKTGVHARKSSCDCGHVFYETKTKQKAPSSNTGAGPGRKQCGNCNQFVGVRNAVCPNCKTEFTKAEAVSKVKALKAENLGEQIKLFKITRGTGNTNLKVCLVPAGVCPVKVTDWTKEGLLDWASAVQVEMEKKGYTMANEALAYWARTFFVFYKDDEKETLVKETFPVDKEGI